MARHVSQCMAKPMCVTHGMPCVNMHGTFEDYIYEYPVEFQGSSWRASRRKGRKEKRNGGKKGKRKNKREEKMRKRKRGKGNRKMKECRVVSRPER